MVMVDNKKAVPPPRATASDSLPHFAVFSSHHATTPEDYRDMAGLLTLADFPSVGPKDQAKLIAPHDGQGKTKEHAQDAMFGAIVIDHDGGNPWQLHANWSQRR